MIILECINPFLELTPKIKEAIAKGAPVPKLGGLYEVIEYVMIDNTDDYPHLKEAGIDKYNGYVLKEIDFSEYGLKVAWRKGNFRIHKEEFIPNENGVEEMKMFMSFSFDKPDSHGDDMSSTTWIHNGE